MNFKIWFLNEVHQDIVDKVIANIKDKDKPFADIFGEKDRIVIPYTPESTSLENKIISKLRNVGEIDFDKGIIKINKRDYRIGRFILQSQQDNKTNKVVLQKPSENTKPYFADEEINWWNTAGDPIKLLKVNNEKEKYAVIVSRNVVDVLRMSDHDGWTSCHAPTGKFFHCAIAESKNAGGLAYVVRKEDLKKIDLNKHEIFKDDDRKIDGVEPIARLRIRLFKNKEDGHDLAMPEDIVYGLDLDGLQDTIRKWAYEVQEDKLSHRPRLKEYELMGGSYQDTGASELFNKFFGDNLDFGKAEYRGENQKDLEELYKKEVNETKNEFNYISKFFTFHAEIKIEEYHPFVHYGSNFSVSFPNAILEKDFEIRDKEKFYYWGDKHDIHQIKNISMNENKEGLIVNFELTDIYDESSPDSFHDFCSRLVETEKNIEKIKTSLYYLLTSLGYVKKNVACSAIGKDNHMVLSRLKNFQQEKEIRRVHHLIEYELKIKQPIDLYSIDNKHENIKYKGFIVKDSKETVYHDYDFIKTIFYGSESKSVFYPSLEHKLFDVIKYAIFNLNEFSQDQKMDFQKYVYDLIKLKLLIAKDPSSPYTTVKLDIEFDVKSYENDKNISQLFNFLDLIDKNYNQLVSSIKTETHKLLDSYLKTFFKNV